MLMKKKVLALLGLALCLNLTAMAKIPSDDISLGGICPDYTIDYVQSIYGEGDYTPMITAQNYIDQQFLMAAPLNFGQMPVLLMHSRKLP